MPLALLPDAGEGVGVPSLAEQQITRILEMTKKMKAARRHDDDDTRAGHSLGDPISNERQWYRQCISFGVGVGVGVD